MNKLCKTHNKLQELFCSSCHSKDSKTELMCPLCHCDHLTKVHHIRSLHVSELFKQKASMLNHKIESQKEGNTDLHYLSGVAAEITAKSVKAKQEIEARLSYLEKFIAEQRKRSNKCYMALARERNGVIRKISVKKMALERYCKYGTAVAIEAEELAKNKVVYLVLKFRQRETSNAYLYQGNNDLFGEGILSTLLDDILNKSSGFKAKKHLNYKNEVKCEDFFR